MSYCVVDFETGSTEHKGRKGSPWANKILAIGLKYKYHHFGFDGEDEAFKLYTLVQDYMPKGWLYGVEMLIGHNIKFDLLHIWRNDELQSYFRMGGRIWDTQLAEYILSGQRSKYASLRDIATSKYGCEERTKKIEEGLKAGIMTQDMDIEDLLFDVRNDVLDTEAIALQQVKIAKQTGMYRLIVEENEALLATTEMEANGLHVDKQVLTTNKLNLQIEYENRLKQLLLIVERYWK
jgi:DNA polymerase I-like protein with 3'-5' exonuclease and polymerase domains